MRDRQDRDARLALGRPQQALDVEGLAFEPRGEAGRCEQVVQRHRQAEAVLGGVEGLEVHDTDALDARVLDFLDQAAEIEADPRPPTAVQDLREQDVFATADRVGIEAEQGEQAGDRGHHALAHGVVVLAHGFGRRGEGTEHGQGQAGTAAGRVDRDVGRVLEALDACAVLAPGGEALAPEIGRGLGVLGDGPSLARRFAGIDPRLEALGREVGEGQHQVAEIALGIDRNGRHAVEGGLFEQRDAQARLARTRHADTHAVGRQVLGVVHEQLVGDVVRVHVEGLAQVEGTQLLVRR